MAGKVKLGQKKKDKFIGFRAESELIERLNSVLSSNVLFKGYDVSISAYIRKLVLKQLKEDEKVIESMGGKNVNAVLEDVFVNEKSKNRGFTSISPTMLSARHDQLP